jgi:hypothetical protein
MPIVCLEEDKNQKVLIVCIHFIASKTQITVLAGPDSIYPGANVINIFTGVNWVRLG